MGSCCDSSNHVWGQGKRNGRSLKLWPRKAIELFELTGIFYENLEGKNAERDADNETWLVTFQKEIKVLLGLFE